MTRPRTPADAGYTLIEMVVTIVVAGVLMAIAVSGWQGWARSSAQDGLATQLQGVLRQAQQRAVAEGSSICVDFDEVAETWTIRRGACGTGGAVLESAVRAESGLDLVAPSFSTASGPLPGVTFTPRGSATPGSVRIRRSGSSTVIRLSVEGLTGRVTSS